MTLHLSSPSRPVVPPIIVVSGVMVILVLFGSLWGYFAPPHDPVAQDFSKRLMPPDLINLFGTDRFGRDIFSRLLVGARPTILVSTASTLLACTIGIPYGVLCGGAGRLGKILSRILDGIQAFPTLLLTLLFVTVSGSRYEIIVVSIGLSFSPLVARVAEGIVTSEIGRDYVLAARAIGVSPFAILVRHILPNDASVLLVQATSVLALTILSEAALSYLGLGPSTLVPTWGRMLFDARETMELAPHTVLAPLIAISTLVISVNLLGDGLRDVLDPTLVD